MHPLAKFDLVYLASPYSNYPGGLDLAFRDVARVAGHLLAKGVSVYSPIVHTHPLAIYGGLDPRDHNLFLTFDEAMMRVCDALAIAKMDTWEMSVGVQYETDMFLEAGRPVFYVDPVTLDAEAEMTIDMFPFRIMEEHT